MYSIEVQCFLVHCEGYLTQSAPIAHAISICSKQGSPFLEVYPMQDSHVNRPGPTQTGKFITCDHCVMQPISTFFAA